MDYNGLTIGFHGCEREVAKEVLLNRCDLIASGNRYDWLGSGIYFWENDPFRAMEFAKYVKQCADPCVIGAVLNLGYCLDLSTRNGLENVRMVWANIVKPIYDKGDLRPKKPMNQECISSPATQL